MHVSKKLLLGSSILAGFAFAGPIAAYAQPAGEPTTTASSTTTNPPPAKEPEAELVVTGSRIKRTEYTSPSPIQVITTEVSTLQGLVDTTQILQTSTLASGSFQVNNQLTGFVTDGGPGANTISLRGLGATRTLVLLNGRRVGPAGTRGTVGPVDLNVIPTSIVDRFEILKDGASSIYGSDAVAGVVNIITKTNLDGGVIDLYGNKAFDKGGDSYRGSLAWGKTFDRGYFTVAGDYYEQKVLRRGDRDDTSCAADLLFDGTSRLPVDYTNSDPSQMGRHENNFKCFNLFARVLRTGNYGDLIYPDAGVVYPTAGQGNSGGSTAQGGFGSNPVPFGFVRQGRAGFPDTFPYAHQDAPPFARASVVSPVKRYSLYATAGFDLTPTTKLYGELLLNRRESIQFGSRQFFPGVSTANVNIPAAWEAAGVTRLGTLLPIIPLASDRNQKVDYVRGVVGVTGDFGSALNGWTWDIFAQYSKSDADYTTDIIFNDRVLAVTGAAACDQTLITISGGQCSALPGGIAWGSSRILNGDFNDAERAFLFTKETGNTTYEQKAVEASVSGTLFQLPAGPLGIAAGFVIRRDEIDDTPGLNERSGNLWGSTSAGRTAGVDTVKEIFGEVEVPILKGIPMFESLDFQGSARYTHYDSYGSGTTYKAGLNWQVTPWAKLRGTYGTSFRAPALFELYLANQTSFLGQLSVDPCILYEDSGDQILAQNCAAAGVPEGYTGAGTSSALIVTGGGIGILKAETSKAKTIGVVLTPSFTNLSIALDYFEIQVKDEVRQFGAANIANQCYTSPTFPNEPFCTLIQRDNTATSHQITQINNSYVNVADQINRGIDLTLRWQQDIDVFGRLTVDGQFTWQLEDVTTLLQGAAQEDFNGTTYNYDGPDFTGRVNTRIDKGDWTFFWGMTIIGKGSDTEQIGGDVFTQTRYSSTCRVSGGPALPCFSLLGSGPLTVVGRPVYFKQYNELTIYNDVAIRRKFDQWTLQFGIQNVADERPPSQSTLQFRVGTAALNGFDMVGRRAYVNVTRRW
jgi:iron complex outermembrane receptor protein